MGVMPCARNGCGNILCSKHSNTHGYICDERFDERRASNVASVAAFMRSVRGVKNLSWWERFVDEEFGVNNG